MVAEKSEGKSTRKRRFGLKRLRGAFRRSHEKARDKLGDSLPLLQHLEELRQRTFKAFFALIVTTMVGFLFSEQLIDYFTQPLGGREVLVSIDVTENIAIFMRVSILAGIVMGMPFVVYQIMRFVMPGLKKQERLWTFLMVPLASLLFAGGVAFTWFVMIPTAIPFLINFLGITTQVRPSNYFEFTTRLMFWIGLSFEMPLVAMLLAKLKFITARQLVQGWRYAVVFIALVAGIVTPTVDPVNMGLVMIPLSGLYIVSIVLAAIAGRS